MPNMNEGTIYRLLAEIMGEARATETLDRLHLDPALADQHGAQVSRAAIAMALNALLFADLLERVPSGARYVDHAQGEGRRVSFDHGALRTIRFANGPTGALPAGIDAFDRILVPLGYEDAATYPLPKLNMTGHAYRHRDLPEAVPQFFVSELHVENFDAEFEGAAQRIFGQSRDPIDAGTAALLGRLSERKQLDFEEAVAILPVLASAFGRHHGDCAFSDYTILLSQSAEAAWIATEGNAFNHATDRVEDVDALAEELRAGGWDIKPAVEVSTSGRVRQTALRADMVKRRFLAEDGGEIMRSVPGSFYEFITRDRLPDSDRLDLAFDSGNATGIFGMTKAS